MNSVTTNITPPHILSESLGLVQMLPGSKSWKMKSSLSPAAKTAHLVSAPQCEEGCPRDLTHGFWSLTPARLKYSLSICLTVPEALYNNRGQHSLWRVLQQIFSTAFSTTDFENAPLSFFPWDQACHYQPLLLTIRWQPRSHWKWESLRQLTMK